MNSRAAFWGMLVVFIALLGALGYLVTQGPEPATPTEPAATMASRDNAPVPEPAPEADLPAPVAEVDAGTEPEPEPEAAPTREPRRTRRSPSGRGSISGTVTLGEGMRREDVDIVLVRVEERIEDDPEAEAPDWQQKLDGKNAFRFDNLPLGRYWLKGRTENAVAASMPNLTREDPDFTVNMALVPSGTLEGRVVNAGGEPVEGARVYIRGTGENNYSIPEANVLATRVTTDEDGYFFSRDHGVTKHWVKVAAEGYADQGYGPIDVNTPGAVITLHGGGSVSGIVVAAGTNAPVPGLKVEISEAKTKVSEETTSDDEGRFTVASLAPGDYVGQVERDEYVMPEAAKFTVRDAAETKDVRLVVEQAARISGRVYDEDTGAGISGISVYASGAGRGTSAETRTDGTYTINGLAGGQYGVNLRRGADFEYGDRYDPPRMVNVPAGGEITEIDFTLSKGLHIAGRVINQDGEPVGSARVSAQTTMDWRNRGEGRTDADGQFTVYGLSPASDVKANVYVEGYGRTESGPYDLTKGSLDGVEIVVTSEATIEGVVVDQHGAPVPKATVHIWLMREGRGRMGYQENADESGAFRVTKLPAGTCKLHPMPAGAQGGMPDDSQMQSFTVAAGEHVTGVRLVLDTSGLGSISGRITNEAGEPLRHASVNASGGPNMRSHTWAQAGEDGNYVLNGLTEGAYRLQVNAGSYAGQTMEEVPTGSKNIDFVLGKCGRISGTVVDARTRQPITHFEVAKSHPQQSQPNNYVNFTAFSNEEGRFEVEALGQGATKLFVRAADYAMGTETIGELGPGEVVDNVVIALEGAQPLHGVVVDAGGAPVSGAYILVDNAQTYNPEQSAQALSAPDGTFTLSYLSPGVHTIHAHHDDYVPSSVEVDTSRQSEVEIVMGHGGTIAGIVTLGGSGVAGARVSTYAMGGGGQHKSAETDADGRFLMEGIAPGVVSVSCNLEQEGTQRMQSVQAEVANGATTEVTIAFSMATAAVEGRVLMGDGSPAHATVQATQGEIAMGVAHAETDAEGYYRLTGLSAGATTVMAMIQVEGSQQPIMQTAQLELTEGETAYHDFNLAEAAAVTCNVSGAPADSPAVSVVALRGAVDVPDLTMDNYMGLMQDMAGVGVVMGGNGSTVIYGLTPGDYTLLGLAAHSNPGADPFADAAIASVGLSITPSQKDYEVDLVF